MVFKYLMYRLKPDGKGKMVPDTNRTPAYLHVRDLACLRHLEELKNIEMDGIYISNRALLTLTRLHIKLLRKHKMWNPLVKTRQYLCNKVVQVQW